LVGTVALLPTLRPAIVPLNPCSKLFEIKPLYLEHVLIFLNMHAAHIADKRFLP